MQHKILIVEDEEIIRLGLQDNFELENYIVETLLTAKKPSPRRTPSTASGYS
jgi:hypothetical protein